MRQSALCVLITNTELSRHFCLLLRYNARLIAPYRPTRVTMGMRIMQAQACYKEADYQGICDD